MSLPSSPFDATKSLFAARSRIDLRPSPALTGVTATASTDVISKTAHGLSDGDMVNFVSGTGFTGLTAGNNYYVRDSDADSFKVSATSGGSAVNISVDGTAGVFQRVIVFEAGQLDDDSQEPQEKTITLPDDNGVNRPVRRMVTDQAESWSFVLFEIKRLLDIFDGSLQGRITADAILWIPDPDDESGKCALKSESFSATITRGGNVSFGNSDFSKATIKIASNKNGSVSWTADASTS